MECTLRSPCSAAGARLAGGSFREINVLQHRYDAARAGSSGRRSPRRLSLPEDLKSYRGTGASRTDERRRAGFNNEKWDLKFLDLIAKDPRKLVAMATRLLRLGGNRSAEEIMWLAMRGAISPRARKITRTTTCR